ncbi:MAG: 3-deoxy-manno-octulosonate cytidylyltransferase [Candidatus Marinimicrobia bacterium]|nr:3-deoxy-manno-octulosonate cytidylyltransferase [Candidatus Neomarinimicrobiota bacterium]
MNRIVCIIPARLGSYRFRDKPFVDICGKSMLEHVYKRAALCKMLDEVYVATPNQEIVDHVEKFGGKAIMTSDDVRRASDRVAQAAKKIEPADIIVNLQGDEPLVFPEMIEMAIQPLLDDPSLSCVNLAKRVSYEEASNIHEVKVVCDEQNNAMYFSREAIPSKFMGDKEIEYLIEVCVFPFTRSSLEEFARLPSTKNEIIESIDMLRFLEHGHKIRIVETEYETYSVDVPSDLDKVIQVMEKDELRKSY